MCQTEYLDDYKLQNIDFIRNAIQKRLNEGKEQFAILPMGYWGKKTQILLEKEFHIQPKVCFDNYLFDDRNVYPVNAIKSMDLSDTVLLLAVEKEEWRGHMYQQVASYVSDSLVELLPLFSAEQKKVFESTEKVHLNFLCAGFHKCGTTSLQMALQQNKYIFLPDVKETFFMTAVEESTHRKFKQNYPSDSNKDLKIFVGGIEPTYSFYAASVYRYFGKDLKLLFLVRNPVKALKSAFKMSMREVDRQGFELIKKYGKICPDLMKDYINTYYRRFIYIDFIRIYERYYPQAQIKIILAEELIQNPNLQMDEIQEFIGLPKRSRVLCNDFPYENKGDAVFKDLGGAYVNHALNELRMWVEDVSLYLQIDKIRKKTFALTTTEFNFDQYEDIWEDAYYYYSDSIAALEERIGRSLKGVW